MARPFCLRKVEVLPSSQYFKPRGIPLSELEEVTLAVDELEALRLADHEGLYQEQAAERMGISRQTFGRIIDSAHRKVGEALVEGKALRIEGGHIEMTTQRNFVCSDCAKQWGVAHGTGRPTECPNCQSESVHRSMANRGRGRQGTWGRGPGGGKAMGHGQSWRGRGGRGNQGGQVQ